MFGNRGKGRRQGDVEQSLLGPETSHWQTASDAAVETEAGHDPNRRTGFMETSDLPASTNPIAHSRTWNSEPDQPPDMGSIGGPDRGHGYYAFARERDHKPSLVSIGR